MVFTGLQEPYITLHFHVSCSLMNTTLKSSVQLRIFKSLCRFIAVVRNDLYGGGGGEWGGVGSCIPLNAILKGFSLNYSIKSVPLLM